MGPLATSEHLKTPPASSKTTDFFCIRLREWKRYKRTCACSTLRSSLSASDTFGDEFSTFSIRELTSLCQMFITDASFSFCGRSSRTWAQKIYQYYSNWQYNKKKLVERRLLRAQTSGTVCKIQPTCAKTAKVLGYTWSGQASVFHGDTPRWFSRQVCNDVKLECVIRLWVNLVKAPENSQ